MKAHGYADLSWQDTTLVLYVYGPFNEEGAALVNQQIKEAVLNKNIQHWYRIEVLDNETMGDPLAMEVVKELYLWAQKNGCYATAVVVNNRIQEPAVAGIAAQDNVKAFYTLEDASAWISEQ